MRTTVIVSMVTQGKRQMVKYNQSFLLLFSCVHLFFLSGCKDGIFRYVRHIISLADAVGRIILGEPHDVKRSRTGSLHQLEFHVYGRSVCCPPIDTGQSLIQMSAVWTFLFPALALMHMFFNHFLPPCPHKSLLPPPSPPHHHHIFRPSPVVDQRRLCCFHSLTTSFLYLSLRCSSPSSSPSSPWAASAAPTTC